MARYFKKKKMQTLYLVQLMLDWHHLASDGSIYMNPHTCKSPAASRDWPQNSEWPTLGACEEARLLVADVT